MLRNVLYPVLLSLTILLSFSGCKKETIIVSPAEQTANEIRSVAEKNNISGVFATRIGQFPGQFPAEATTTWTISNGFFNPNYSSMPSYNLAYLVSYNISNVTLSNGTSSKALILYFQ
ncbi:hypothetical protein LZZ85_03730 [Terrimonas sp. NA20]|uniref:Uncharacterized protein n=1 Tax=Terrimonas ginsenosidimutans TaxID=2908004 RepID=A0ABS9KM24_9BACT|nr:hypothetical protein [Terrimonas ginsenosidimutans]MCG2613371.1 hypothetical protein [Terrimonas ginsenosidimutans]